MQLKKIIIILGLLVGAVGCAQQQVKQDVSPSDLASLEGQHYDLGMVLIRQGDFAAAINEFKTQINLYPGARDTEKAALQTVYAHYKLNQLEATASAAERFIKKYPSSKELDYAYYSQGLALFNIELEKKSISPELVSSEARQAYESFSALVMNFPESKYVDDSIQRMFFLREKLAESEVSQARMALEDGKYGTAVVHSKYVIENYNDSSAAIDALEVLTQSYHLLGLNSQGKVLALEDDTVEGIVVDENQGEKDGSLIENAVVDGTGWGNIDWLNRQNGADYTLQVLMSRSEKGIAGVIDQYDLFSSANYAYYPVKFKGEIWYSLVYGAFSTVLMAEEAVKSLPQAFAKNEPWIRKIGTLHKIVKTRGY